MWIYLTQQFHSWDNDSVGKTKKLMNKDAHYIIAYNKKN